MLRRPRRPGRWTAVAVVVATAAIAAVVAIILHGGPSGGVVRDAAIDLGLVQGPFAVRLDGPLWSDRTRIDAGGARDVGLVTADRPLRVRARSREGASIAQVELRVDGRVQRVVATGCNGGRCPTSAAVTVVPRIRGLAVGDHRVEVLVRDPRGVGGTSGADQYVAVRRFHVRSAARLPPAAESEPVRALASPPPSPVTTRFERTARRVLAQERATPRLAGALAGARVTVVQVGKLNVGGRALGAMILVRLAVPRRNVSAVVPGYGPPAEGSPAPYDAQRVRMRVSVLRDALIDIDLGTRRVIAFEPGPDSRTTTWSPSESPAPAGAEDED